jgi:RNA-binding protein YhbY
MRRGFLKFQIGKNGINAGLIQGLNLAFKKNKTARIGVLRSASNERKKIEETAKELADKLSGKYKFKIIGFTIVMRKIGIKSKKQGL